MPHRAPKAVRVPEVDVEEVRLGTGLSVEEFAHRFGLTPASVRSWEQGRTQPYGVARIPLAIIAAHPEVVDEVLRSPANLVGGKLAVKERL